MFGKTGCIWFVTAMVTMVAVTTRAAENFEQCEIALGHEGALDELYRMEQVLNRDLLVNYRRFCKSDVALTTSYPKYLYQRTEKKKKAGRALAWIAAPSVLAAAAGAGAVFWAMSMQAQNEADEDEWFPGLGEAVMALTIWVAGGVTALALWVTGTIIMAKRNRQMKKLRPYTDTERKMKNHMDIVLLPVGPGVSVTF